MRIAIAGGTGTVGAETARELERRGQEVRVLSRCVTTSASRSSASTAQFAGPEVLSGCELARRWRRRTGSHAVPVTRALRSAALTNPDSRRDSVTFDTWLEAA